MAYYVAEAMSWLRTVAGVAYSAAIGFLVGALIWQTGRALLPPMATFLIGAILAVRVATLFASVTTAATLNGRAIWLGGAAGLIGVAATWPSPSALMAAASPIALTPLVAAAVAVAVAAATLPAPPASGYFTSAGFARFLHHLQGFILFGCVLPASLAWEWPRPHAAALIVSAFALWKLWSACPLTLAENEARRREGRAIMPPDSGFVPDVLARFGVTLSGNTVGLALYGLGLSLCSWWSVVWLIEM